jgi:hypothetical protein
MTKGCGTFIQRGILPPGMSSTLPKKFTTVRFDVPNQVE